VQPISRRSRPMSDLDPAAIMAAHRREHQCGVDRLHYLPTDERCQVYRLAAALAAAERDLAAERAKVERAKADAWDEGQQAEFNAGGRRWAPTNPYRAAPAGEGAADQPERATDD
jgi:hypothetical protein